MIVNAELGHVKAVGHANVVPSEQVLLEDMLATIPDPEMVLSTFARTLMHEWKPIAVAGVWPMWPGVSRAWAIFTPESKARPKELFSMVKGLIDYVTARDELHRLEAVVVSGHTAGHRLLRHLGFEREGLMRKFSADGSDYHMYARIT